MKNRKRIILLILLLVIGFASVSTTLVINGIIGISNNKNDFNIIFTNAKLDGVEKKEFIDSETKQTINYETNKLTTINQTTTLKYDVTNTSRLYDADVSISCTPTNNDYISIEYTPTSMRVLAGETKSGSITTKLIKGSTEDKSIKIKCTLNASATERESLGEEYKEPVTYELTVDNNTNGIADVGDEITVGTESFYVISHTDTELNALAKYNLKVGNIYSSDGKNKERTISSTEEGYGLQNEQMKGYVPGGKRYGTLAFSNSNGWQLGETINIKDHEGPAKTILYGENGYEKYIQEIVPTASIRLITNSELEALGCSTTNYTCASAPNWVYSTSYWTQSADLSNINYVWRVSSNGGFGSGNGYLNGYTYGLRPVITFS